VQNLLRKTVDFPYVFGGDGATLLVPNQHATGCREGTCSTEEPVAAQLWFDTASRYG
jgi:hypothetical protein